MHLLGDRVLGTAILILLAVLVFVKGAASGSIMKERPRGGIRLWIVHVFNMFFLLLVNPLAAVLLIGRWLENVDVTRVTVGAHGLLRALEICGAALYLAGFMLMAWALITLGRSYQAGGNTPRSGDVMVARGPYRLIRHPMYSAALCISLGLACLTQSLACLAVFCIYLVLIVLLIPFEEEGLRKAYGEGYTAYALGTRRLIPFIV